MEGRLNIFPDALSLSFKNPWEPESDKDKEAMCFAAKAEVPPKQSGLWLPILPQS